MDVDNFPRMSDNNPQLLALDQEENQAQNINLNLNQNASKGMGKRVYSQKIIKSTSLKGKSRKKKVGKNSSNGSKPASKKKLGKKISKSTSSKDFPKLFRDSSDQRDKAL